MNTTTQHPTTRTTEVDHERIEPGELGVLIVGTFGGGGIHRYIDEQRDHLADRFDVTTYDMYSDPIGSGRVWFARSLLLGLFAMLTFPFRSPPDVAHVHTSHQYSFYRASFYVLFIKYVWRRPIVLHIHGSSFDEFVATDSTLVSWLQSTVFSATDEVVVLSPYWRDVLEQVTGETTISVVPNAVDPGDYDPSYSSSVPHVVFVSNMVARKGVRELVRALESLQARVDRDFRVSIAGAGPLESHVERIADEYDNVEYLGYVSEERKRELLNEGSVFVLPTYAEGLPIAMLEGMAGGNAIVSTTVGSIPEVVDDDRGILIEPVDEDQLADALVSLVTDPDRVESMGRENARAIRETYSWGAATDALARIYVENAGVSS